MKAADDEDEAKGSGSTSLTGDIMEKAVIYFLSDVQPELDNFASEQATVFQSLSTEELLGKDNKVEYYEVYKQFVDIFEKKMAEFLDEKGVSTQEFVNAVENAIAEDKQGAESFGTVFVELMEAISGYEKFLMYMREETDMLEASSDQIAESKMDGRAHDELKGGNGDEKK